LAEGKAQEGTAVEWGRDGTGRKALMLFLSLFLQILSVLRPMLGLGLDLDLRHRVWFWFLDPAVVPALGGLVVDEDVVVVTPGHCRC
jgi:hypothetical protein